MTEQSQDAKTSFVTIFDDTYNQPDCRAYFRMMDALGYRNQHHAVAAFRAGLAEMMRLRGLTSARILDFASSYGIVSALMGHDLTLAEVFERYRDSAFDGLDASEVIRRDRAWLKSIRRTAPPMRFVGLDVAPNAVAYGLGAGLFDAGFVEDLQENPASPDLVAEVAQCDMIVECGSVAQLMPEALDRLLTAAGAQKPWVMTSPIRGNERPEAAQVLRDHGLVVERVPVPAFVHRRFESADEQARAIANARAQGHDTEGVETTGHFHAEVLLARPANEAGPLSEWALPLSIAPMA